MVPRNPSHIGPDGRGFFGTVTVGQRGQVALPTQARKHVGLEPGDQLIVLTDPAQGLALIPLASLLERAPKDDPLAMLVRSAFGGQGPSAPEAGADDPDPARTRVSLQKRALPPRRAPLRIRVPHHLPPRSRPRRSDNEYCNHR